jgi:hypothetical protein
MDKFKAKNYSSSRPEAKVQASIVEMLERYKWFVKSTHGNAYTDGWPDLFACHQTYGQRWIEVKLPEFKGSRFTDAQLRDFPEFCRNGSGVWVLTSATDYEYKLLFRSPNYWVYLLSMRGIK